MALRAGRSSISTHSSSAISIRYIMDRVENNILNIDIAISVKAVHFRKKHEASNRRTLNETNAGFHEIVRFSCIIGSSDV
mmetsp:Transcript_2418/g.3545  ORF Transcript_2418/g.3545 Transcript_2418/m.3545 type:complete len:80 (-) Transcript_2418:2242-2481(-)